MFGIYPPNPIKPSTTTPVFNHGAFQFSYLNQTPNGIMKAYLSRHELFLMVNKSDYVGIVGARVSSGNILGTQDVNGSVIIKKDNNHNYFTYRFIGLDNVVPNYNPLPSDVIDLKKSISSKNINEWDTSIPGETWASPCPPMWNQQ